MVQSRHQRHILLPLLLAVGVAIGLLALLQLYLIDQISIGYRERMRANLRSGVTRFSEDFDRELVLAYLSLQMDAETMNSGKWSRYSARYQRWSQSTPYSGLVKNIYLAQLYAGRRATLLEFEPQNNNFQLVNWPQDLVPLRDTFAQASRGIGADETLTPIPPIASDVPALVVPLSRVVKLSDQQEMVVEANLVFGDDVISSVPHRCATCRSLSRTPLFAYTVLVLDKAYLTEHFIPTLAQRYFSTNGQLDYNVTVVDRLNPSDVIYRSGKTQGTGADETTSVLDIRLDSFSNLIGSAAVESDSLRSDPLSERLLVGVYGRDTSVEDAAVRGRWEVILTHRDGSLEAAVAALRFRNLLISGGILLLLAVILMLIVVATRRAQRLARQQIAFAAGVSHELRTPLAVICSAGENLADGVIRDEQQIRQYGTVINTEGRRLADMVEQVLAFAGAQGRQRPPDLMPTDVRSSIERAISASCPMRERDQYTFQIDLPADLPLVLVDQQMFLRALQNLIDNAMKYGGDRQWVGISATEETGVRGREVRISVRDTGRGIDPGDLAHIFEPFYRARSVVEAQIHGNGLGLSLVRYIVASLDGSLSVESSPGRGSTFSLVLPAAIGPELVPLGTPII